MRSIILLITMMSMTVAEAAPVRFSSGATRTHLVELYTSEGCSSCPPAEQWLSKLGGESGLWRDFVPVSFHVNYWDHLGWKDEWGSQAGTVREHRYAGEWGQSTVYTPCFVMDGLEWRPRSTPPEASAPAAVLTAEEESSGRVRITYSASSPGLEAHLALLGSGIRTDVLAGENEGRTLAHDFVVLDVRNGELSGGSVVLDLPTTRLREVKRRALAVWVTRRGSLAPLQATGGWLE